VPVGELLDVVDATARVEGGRARTLVLVRHPLQPFDPRNFVAGESWSFDPVTLEGARALTGPRTPPPPFLRGPLPPADNAIVDSENLVRFVQHPVRAFLRQRLGISVGDYSDEIEDDLSVELDGLGKWGVGERLLKARLAGVDARTAVLAEIARGTLPPGVLGKPVVDEVFSIAEEIVGEAEALVAGGSSPGSVDVSVVLPDGRSIRGTVPGVSGDVLRNVTYSRVAPKHRLAAWVRLLALTAAHPQRSFGAATIGRAGGSARVRIARIAPLSADDALGHLATLADLHERGMREPLPLYCAASAAYADAARNGRNAVAAARKEWKSEWNFEKEDSELEHQFVLGGVLDFDELLLRAPRLDEAGEGWDMSESTRFGRLARRLWDGLLAVEQLTSR
jgi:exodeoxyribonuclease V gamma subunit